jgi:hypothetical protein
MSMGKRVAVLRGLSFVAGTLVLGAATGIGMMAAQATETLSLKTVVSVPGGKITSFDISFVDPASGYYVLGDRTNNGVTMIHTYNNPPNFVMVAGAGAFRGTAACPPPSTSTTACGGPNGVMIVNHREIWAGDGDSTVKFLSLFTGALLGSVSTGGQFRADEMCYDPVHGIGFRRQ